MSIDVDIEVLEISRRLRSVAPEIVDPRPVIVTERPFHGAPIGALRATARSWHRAHRGASVVEVAKLADALWETAVREEMVVAAMLLGADERTRRATGVRRLDRWGRLLDNWETTDQLGQSLVAPWVADAPARTSTLDLLAGRRNPWLRRLSLVGAIGVVRDGSWAPGAALILRLHRDREAAIPKAISWLMREGTRTCRIDVETFLERYRTELPAIAVRETRRKLDTGRKA